MTNNELKQYARNKGVKLWQIAYELGMSDSLFTRRMRNELDEEQKRIFIEVIDKLSLSVDISRINDKRKAYRVKYQQEKVQLRKRDINKAISIGKSINELTTLMIEVNKSIQEQIQAVQKIIGEEE